MVCGILLGGILSAMAVAAAPPADYFEEFPVMLTASRLNQSAHQAPSALTVIDREMIAASGARKLVDVLRLIPGFYTGNYSGTNTTLAYHGLADDSGKLMQVLIDGVSNYSALNGARSWTELPVSLQDIERIEVVRGPSSVTYGANAFFAVINIITRDPATEPRFQVEANAGGDGIRDVVAHTAQQGENLRYRISVGQTNDDGKASMPDTSRIDFANMRAHYRFNPADELVVQMRSSRSSELHGTYSPGIDPARPVSLAMNNVQLRWNRAQNADDDLWVQYSYYDNQLTDIRSLLLPIPGMPSLLPLDVDTSYKERREDVEFQRTQKPANSVRLAWGGQWRQDAAQSRANFNTDAWLTNQLSRLFGNLEWRPTDLLTLNGGAMYEYNSLTGSSISPRLAANYLLHPEHTLRFAISRAVRAPTLFEERTDQTIAAPALLARRFPGIPLSILTLSSGNLADTKLLSREFGYVAEIPQWKLSGDVRLFNDQIEKMIASLPNRPVVSLMNKQAYDFYNAQPSAQERGAELGLHWRPWIGTQIRANASYTHVDSANPDIVRSLPSHVQSLLLSQALPQQFAFSVGYYKVSSMVWQGWELAPTLTPAYHTVDMRLARQYFVDNHHVELALVARNAIVSNAMERQTFMQLKFEY